MKTTNNRHIVLICILVFLSGSSGLIYEVVWHRYLSILLGAQAKATAIILAIFLGGIAAGYFTFGSWTRHKKWNLLFVYALIEVMLAFWAFSFPYIFKVAMPAAGFLYSVLGINNILIDFLLSILLIGFPTFLMGGTLPLLTQGLSRGLEDASRTHALIYGFNTVGACFGCLISGYLLIPATGLAVTTTIGGVLNVIVGLISYFVFAKKSAAQTVTPVAAKKSLKEEFNLTQLVLLGIGFLSGFYILSLQTILIRVMGLSTGASNYNFTLIVSVFVFALGFGSLVVRGIAKYPLSRLVTNQVLLVVFLFLLYRSGNNWSYWVHVLRAGLRDIPQNFGFYHALLGAFFFALLILPLGLAGLTLPLCFHFIKDRPESLGQRVGQLYGLNTAGCVFGALVGGYFLFEFLDLDQLFKVCVFLAGLSAFGAGYLYFMDVGRSDRRLIVSGSIVGIVLMSTLFSPLYDKSRFIQPFRHPNPTEATYQGPEAFGRWLGRNTEMVYWKDGPNTSLGVGSSRYQGQEVSRTVFVNGKSDGNTRGDLFTTVMLAHIPGLLSAKLNRVAVIGFGTGITVGTLARYPQIKQIEVAEISSTIIQNAHQYDAFNWSASKSHKLHFNEMDAFRYLSGTRDTFDVIVSEPSNPWVAGIENLYSKEFYALARAKMDPNGLFVQWIHTYSFTESLMKMVLRTMGQEFSYVHVFQLKGGDLALVGSMFPIGREDLIRASQRYQETPEIRAALQDGGIQNFETVLALEILTPLTTRAVASVGEIHTLESPKLSNEAARAFFIGDSSRIHGVRRNYREYFADLSDSLLAKYLGSGAISNELAQSFKSTFCDEHVSKVNFLCEETLALNQMQRPGSEIDPKYDDMVSRRDLSSVGLVSQKGGNSFNRADLNRLYTIFGNYKKYASPVFNVDKKLLLAPLETCLAKLPMKDELHGECLLQKVLVLETIDMKDQELLAAIQGYLNWYPQLSKTSRNFPRFEEARTILIKMASRIKN